MGDGGEQERDESTANTALRLLTRVLPSLSPEAREGMRVTPQGIFLLPEIVPQLLEAYRKWFLKHTGTNAPSAAKCAKRLFGEEKLPLVYLVEGRSCLIGEYLAGEISSPQQYGVPYYLGTLLDVRHHLHSADPVLAALPGVKVDSGPKGVVLLADVAGRKLKIIRDLLRDFLTMVEHSPQLRRDEREWDGSLSAAAKLLVALLRKARAPREDDVFFVSYGWQRRLKGGDSLLRLGPLLFLVAKNGEVAAMQQVRGSPLHYLIREEVRSRDFQREGRGAPYRYEPVERGERGLGRVQVKGISYLIEYKAFQSFVEEASRISELRNIFPGGHTLGEFIQRFASLLDRAVPFLPRRLPAHLSSWRKRCDCCLNFEGWLFLVERGGRVSEFRSIKERGGPKQAR